MERCEKGEPSAKLRPDVGCRMISPCSLRGPPNRGAASTTFRTGRTGSWLVACDLLMKRVDCRVPEPASPPSFWQIRDNGRAFGKRWKTSSADLRMQDHCVGRASTLFFILEVLQSDGWLQRSVRRRRGSGPSRPPSVELVGFQNQTVVLRIAHPCCGC